ncbi:ASCH domain-containing protein [Pedobacter sp. MC2016-24]|uniref:ASCH domain-containing protein n=1 Tax=Pedobacter sp. MC2016-24 TaxID=2780090 RepID=UPI00188205A5|nr:ASCH domain-containing protein [Pedobacter sp. MC2016-24]MBE9601481.1 ASCH domain-containing protein [Pedobacter sp. MC2016-24]
MSNLILISVKEKYVAEMLTGRKTIELRKAKPKAYPGDTLIIYTTQPRKAITAVALVKNIITCPPAEMWEKYNAKLGIDKASFDNYYGGVNKAIGIEMTEISALNAEILLSAIKTIQPNFTPPQTFKYLNKFATLRDFGHLLS